MVTIAKSIALFVAAAFLEIGGAWLVWQGLREHRGGVWTRPVCNIRVASGDV